VHPRGDAAEENPFDLDRHRIVSCMAFRRLMHKTQVFVTLDGDHFRTRLTHTLEVAAQSERLARMLGLNDRLAGAVAMAHDLGHSPFGHAGEKELQSLMRNHGGFEHNVQSLRVVDYLEHPYPAFRGLNLSYELRESLIKHRTTFDKPDHAGTLDPAARDLLDSGPSCPLEGQIANLADMIAYTLHDIEDGIGQHLLDDDLLGQSALWRESAAVVAKQYAGKSLFALRRPIIDRIAARLAEDASQESRRRIEAARVDTVDAVRRLPRDLIAFSDATRGQLDELQKALIRNVYRHHRVVRMDAKAGRSRALLQAYRRTGRPPGHLRLHRGHDRPVLPARAPAHLCPVPF
jgi:dGTPase